MQKKALSNDEYLAIREETLDNIKKQDKDIDLIIGILGLSSIFSGLIDNVLFLFLIQFVSLIMQLKIISDRNIVSYLASFLQTMSVENLTESRWEARLYVFKKGGYKVDDEVGKVVGRIMSFASGTGDIMKHFGILGLAFYLCIQNIILIRTLTVLRYFVILFIALSLLLFALNILYTFAICNDNLLRDTYTRRWRKIISLEKDEMDIEAWNELKSSLYPSKSSKISHL